MKNTTSKLVMLGLTIILLFGCVSETYKAPEPECIDPKLTKTKTVAQMYTAALAATGDPANTIIYANSSSTVPKDYIEGYVISSDEGGNFYQSMFVEPADKSKGFNISVDIKSAYLERLTPGTKVFLKLNGLAYANPTSKAVGLIFGAKPTGTFPVDRLDNYESFIIPACDRIDEETFVHKKTIAQLIADDTYLNTLVEIDAAQFEDATAGGTYDFNLTNTFDDNTYVVDASTPYKLAVRTSRFANFAGLNTPKKSGKIRGVLTKYNSGYQIVLRTERDVKMTNPRILSLLFTNTVNEPFTSYAFGISSFSKYINDKIIGTRLWSVKQFPLTTGNKFLEMTSYNGVNPGLPSSAYFMVPVDFTAASTFTFSNAARFNKGACLNVYYVKFADVDTSALNPAVFTNITSSFNIIYPALNGSSNSFSNAGTYNIPPTLTGNGFFVFEYIGTSTLTTTMQLDDIIIN